MSSNLETSQGSKPEVSTTVAPEVDSVAVLAAAVRPGGSRVPRIAQALRNHDFRLFWAGNFLSNIGTWMQNIAQGWLVLTLTNSPFWLGVVGFASTIPMLVLGPVGGVIADHVNKRKLLMVTQSAMMVFAFTMAALVFLNKINVAEIILLAMGTGIAMALNTPSYQALVPQLVPRKDLTNAIALNAAQFNMSRVLGPTLGGFAMAAVGISGNYFLNGLSFLAVILALTRIQYPARQAQEESAFWQKLKQGFAYVSGHEGMSSLVLLVAVGSLLAVPYLTFVPYFARDVLRSNERGLGILMACNGIGAFMAAGLMAYEARERHHGRLVVYAGLGFYVSIVVFTFSRSFYLSAAVMVVSGFCMILMAATMNALLQHLADDEMRGRVMSIYSTAFLGLPPIGSLLAGSLTHVVTAPHAIAGMSILAVVGTLWMFAARPALRHLD